MMHVDKIFKKLAILKRTKYIFSLGLQTGIFLRRAIYFVCACTYLRYLIFTCATLPPINAHDICILLWLSLNAKHNPYLSWVVLCTVFSTPLSVTMYSYVCVYMYLDCPV